MTLDYSKMTDQEFDDILEAVVIRQRGAILQVPGVYEAVAEYFNNDVLEIWAAKQRRYDDE